MKVLFRIALLLALVVVGAQACGSAFADPCPNHRCS